MALGIAALQATESPTISAESVERHKSLIETVRSPAGAASRFGDVIRIPGVPDFSIDRL
jgi:hypothetical protein